MNHRAAAARWAAELLERPHVAFLDTETTGLDRLAEVVQVAIVDAAGEVLLDQLVRPTRPIPLAATAIHGITNEQVAGAPTFAEVAGQITAALHGREVVVYNAAYDLRVLTTSATLAGNPPDAVAPITPTGPQALFGVGQWVCAMLWYAQYVGQWSSRTKSYRWQPLPGGDHTALGDARATLQLVRRMATSAEGGA